MILWLDDIVVKPPVNKNYFPLSQPFRRFIRSVNWAGALGLVLMFFSGCISTLAIVYIVNAIRGMM